MRFQFSCCTETLLTITANIRLHTFMTTYMYLKVTTIKCDSQVKSMKYHQWYIQQMCSYFSLKQKSGWSQFLSTSLNVPFHVTFMFVTFIT